MRITAVHNKGFIHNDNNFWSLGFPQAGITKNGATKTTPKKAKLKFKRDCEERKSIIGKTDVEWSNRKNVVSSFSERNFRIENAAIVKNRSESRSQTPIIFKN